MTILKVSTAPFLRFPGTCIFTHLLLCIRLFFSIVLPWYFSACRYLSLCYLESRGCCPLRTCEISSSAHLPPLATPCIDSFCLALLNDAYLPSTTTFLPIPAVHCCLSYLPSSCCRRVEGEICVRPHCNHRKPILLSFGRNTWPHATYSLSCGGS